MIRLYFAQESERVRNNQLFIFNPLLIEKLSFFKKMLNTFTVEHFKHLRPSLFPVQAVDVVSTNIVSRP